MDSHDVRDGDRAASACGVSASGEQRGVLAAFEAKLRWMGVVLVIIGAVGIGGISHLTWMTVHAVDDKQGELTRTLVGTVWAPSMNAVAIALIAACLAMVILKRTGRRILAAVTAVVGVVSLWSPLSVLVSSPGVTRVHNLLVNGQATQKKSHPQTLTEWATVTGIDVHKGTVILTVVASLMAIVGAVVLVIWPGVDSVKGSKYDTTSARRHSLAADLASDEDSGRVLWDAMDAGVDPTQDDAADVARRVADASSDTEGSSSEGIVRQTSSPSIYH
ncbi:TIGR02234 family membrane protein [Corynebacterium kroppenstedtii]|uniref:TIGR02234 family membrane protein n=1 Tax=Corynebacterium sp. PCR 32 TaxID=3351342 RepID=UPI0030AD406E